MEINFMHVARDSMVVIGRILTIFPLLLFTTLFMGRRAIGELPIFDFLIILALGAVVGADIADPKIEHIHTAIAIIVIALMQKIYSVLLVRSKRFGRLVSFEPVVVIKDGLFIVKNMKKERYPIDNILQMLREVDIFDISEVDTAVLEANGKLTAFKKAEKCAVTRNDLGISIQVPAISYPVIIEGRIEKETLEKLNLTEAWLCEQLNSKKIKLSDVFLATANDKHDLNITNLNEQPSAPPILH
ncbi:DUF421 domain-containing protein [Paenibacillus rhizoplanae]|uniref:DUF421 domain-containing protein n=1 Tax=Paenibacillus rhizoplanae TaxID=1917181 RepID=A0ABW5FDW3_9BACL